MKCPHCDGGREYPFHNCETCHGSGRVKKGMPKKSLTFWLDSEKRRAMERILAVWMRHPHLRLGQLISNANNGTDLFFVRDADFADNVERYSKERQVAEVQNS
jgi:hypothetical protein